MGVTLGLSECHKLSVFLSALECVCCVCVCVCGVCVCVCGVCVCVFVRARARACGSKWQHFGQHCVVTSFCLFALQQTRPGLWKVSFRGIRLTAYVARFKATPDLHKVTVQSRVLEITFGINGRILLKLIFLLSQSQASTSA